MVMHWFVSGINLCTLELSRFYDYSFLFLAKINIGGHAHPFV